jgi:hypothetical protein
LSTVAPDDHPDATVLSKRQPNFAAIAICMAVNMLLSDIL